MTNRLTIIFITIFCFCNYTTGTNENKKRIIPTSLGVRQQSGVAYIQARFQPIQYEFDGSLHQTTVVSSFVAQVPLNVEVGTPSTFDKTQQEDTHHNILITQLIKLRADAKRNGEEFPRSIKGHLLNDHVGGPGMPYNFIPMTDSLNRVYETQFETHLKHLTKTYWERCPECGFELKVTPYYIMDDTPGNSIPRNWRQLIRGEHMEAIVTPPVFHDGNPNPYSMKVKIRPTGIRATPTQGQQDYLDAFNAAFRNNYVAEGSSYIGYFINNDDARGVSKIPFPLPPYTDNSNKLTVFRSNTNAIQQTPNNGPSGMTLACSSSQGGQGNTRRKRSPSNTKCVFYLKSGATPEIRRIQTLKENQLSSNLAANIAVVNAKNFLAVIDTLPLEERSKLLAIAAAGNIKIVGDRRSKLQLRNLLQESPSTRLADDKIQTGGLLQAFSSNMANSNSGFGREQQGLELPALVAPIATIRESPSGSLDALPANIPKIGNMASTNIEEARRLAFANTHDEENVATKLENTDSISLNVNPNSGAVNPGLIGGSGSQLYQPVIPSISNYGQNFLTPFRTLGNFGSGGYVNNYIPTPIRNSVTGIGTGGYITNPIRTSYIPSSSRLIGPGK